MIKSYVYDGVTVDRLDSENSVLQLMFESRLDVIRVDSKIKELKYYAHTYDDLHVNVIYMNGDVSVFKVLPFGYVHLVYSQVTGCNYYIQSLLEYQVDGNVNKGLSLLDLNEFIGVFRNGQS